jgi:uncharacterized protein involved in exopolysaccharide biosynthesis
MLPSHSLAQDASVNNLGLDYFAIVKRRIFHFLIPCVVAFTLAALIVAIQHPLYQAQGKILVETSAIPADLVRPTVTDTANQRIQVIQQRIMTRDNLLGIVKKFGLFPSQQEWMSASQILDLMKERTELKLVDLTLPTQLNNLNNLTIAFTLSFEYENPQVAAQVANEFLTLILNEDARNRTNRATETTKFLEQELKRLQGVLASTQMQITEILLKPADQKPADQKPADQINEVPDQLKEQHAELTKLKLDLIQKSALYSSAHPEVITLKKRIAALEKIIAQAPARSEPAPAPAPAPTPAVAHANELAVLKQQLAGTETALEEANRKLSAARLGEAMERNQEAERLQVLEQPVVPQRPIKPNRPKLLALASALAVGVGIATAFAAETLDKSIHNIKELARIVDNRLIVAIPYIATAVEARRRRRRAVVITGIVIIALVALAVALYLGLALDLSDWTDRSWIDQLRHLFK